MCPERVTRKGVSSRGTNKAFAKCGVTSEWAGFVCEHDEASFAAGPVLLELRFSGSLGLVGYGEYA